MKMVTSEKYRVLGLPVLGDVVWETGKDCFEAVIFGQIARDEKEGVNQVNVQRPL